MPPPTTWMELRELSLRAQERERERYESPHSRPAPTPRPPPRPRQMPHRHTWPPQRRVSEYRNGTENAERDSDWNTVYARRLWTQVSARETVYQNYMNYEAPSNENPCDRVEVRNLPSSDSDLYARIEAREATSQLRDMEERKCRCIFRGTTTIYLKRSKNDHISLVAFEEL